MLKASRSRGSLRPCPLCWHGTRAQTQTWGAVYSHKTGLEPLPGERMGTKAAVSALGSGRGGQKHRSSVTDGTHLDSEIKRLVTPDSDHEAGCKLCHHVLGPVRHQQVGKHMVHEQRPRGIGSVTFCVLQSACCAYCRCAMPIITLAKDAGRSTTSTMNGNPEIIDCAILCLPQSACCAYCTCFMPAILLGAKATGRSTTSTTNGIPEITDYATVCLLCR